MGGETRYCGLPNSRLRFCYSFSNDRFCCLLNNFRRNFEKLRIFTIDLSGVHDLEKFALFMEREGINFSRMKGISLRYGTFAF